MRPTSKIVIENFYMKFTDRHEVYDSSTETTSYNHSWDARIRPEDVAEFIKEVLEAYDPL